MNSLKALARRGALASAAAISAAALAACSAGQISQTATKAPAIDGSASGNYATGLAVFDVTVLLDDATGDAAVKFIATNQGAGDAVYQLRSIEVDGRPVKLDRTAPLEVGCRLVGDSKQHLENLPKDEGAACVEYVATSIKNNSFAYGGNVPVVFNFDGADPIETNATVAAPVPQSGTVDRFYGHESHDEHDHSQGESHDHSHSEKHSDSHH